MMQIDTTSFVSPNFSERTKPISAIVLHSGEGTRRSDLEALTGPNGGNPVSSHYYVCRDGTIYQLVKDRDVAWHSGIASYLGITDWNGISLGVETEHKRGQDWPMVQMLALTELCYAKVVQYRIEQRMVVAHRWIAPTRRSDPTDWPDTRLRPWIAGLFAPDYAALWGAVYPYRPQWGIPAAWRPVAQRLGAAVSDELTAANGATYQLFERGAIKFTAGGVVVFEERNT